MGISIGNRHGDRVAFSHIRWATLLIHAGDYGWCPAGTEPPMRWSDETGALRPWEAVAPEPWGGGYSSNDGQGATAADAQALADALERFLADDLTDRDEVGSAGQAEMRPSEAFTPHNWSGSDRATDDPGVAAAAAYLAAFARALNEPLTDTERETVREFIALCRRGPFPIC